MKKQINPKIKAHLVRGALYLLPLLAVSAMPFVLAQRNGLSHSRQFQKTFGLWAPDLSPWSIVASYPEILESPAVASDAAYAYSAGGDLSQVPTNGFYRYDPVADTWTTLAALPQALFDARAVYASNVNKIYVFGGLDAAVNVLGTTYIYDIATDSWSTGASMPDGRYFPNVAYYSSNGKIYVIGGFDPAFNEASQTWEYDPVADTWDTSRMNIPMAMGGSATSIVGQYIYLAGSFGSGGTNLHYRYDILGDSWTAMAPVPVAVYEAAGAAVGSETYVVGGGNPSLAVSGAREDRIIASIKAPATSYNSTYVYDTLADSWTTGPNTNVAHAFTGGTAVGNLLVVIAGFDGSADTNTVETALAPTPSPTPTPGCVYGQGYWKNHPGAWPVTEVQLGNVMYDQQELLSILHQAVRGNGLLILAHQEIAAKLNIANGADGSCIEQTLADADMLIGDLVVPPIGDGYLAPRDASPLAETLDQYNEGFLCAPSCEEAGSPAPTPTPRSRPVRAPRPH